MIRFYFALIQITSTCHTFSTRHKLGLPLRLSSLLSAPTLIDFPSLIAYCLPPWSELISWLLLIASSDSLLLIASHWSRAWNRFLAVFSVSAVTSRSGGWWSRDMCFLWGLSVPWLYKWQNSFGSGTSQFSVGDSHGKFVVEEEYKKSACEDLTCDLKTLCVL
jgi:hypothetical protein